VIGDEGYSGEPDYISTKNEFDPRESAELKERVLARELQSAPQERRLPNYEIPTGSRITSLPLRPLEQHIRVLKVGDYCVAKAQARHLPARDDVQKIGAHVRAQARLRT
jgi:hypothetical protein